MIVPLLWALSHTAMLCFRGFTPAGPTLTWRLLSGPVDSCHAQAPVPEDALGPKRDSEKAFWGITQLAKSLLSVHKALGWSLATQKTECNNALL